MLIHNKNDIEFVTEFPCFLGHPVSLIYYEEINEEIFLTSFDFLKLYFMYLSYFNNRNIGSVCKKMKWGIGLR